MRRKLLILAAMLAVFAGTSQILQAQTTNGNRSKDEAIKRLTELTMPALDEKELIEQDKREEEALKKIRTPEDLKYEKESEQRRREEDVVRFDKALKENRKLTKEQKAFIRENYDELSDLDFEIFIERRRLRYAKEKIETQALVVEKFEKSLAKNFTAEELNELVRFFESSEGTKVVKSMYQKFAEDDDKTATDLYRKAHEAFIKTRLGRRFATSYFRDGYEAAAVQQVNQAVAALEKLEAEQREAKDDPDFYDDDVLTTSEINELFNEYVAEHYREEIEPSGVTKRIRFAKGQSSATVSASVIRGDRDAYIVGAKKGQKMTVKITALENNAAFTILTPGKKYLERAGELDDQTSWTGTLPAGGDYKIEVGGTRGNATYKLTVTIK